MIRNQQKKLECLYRFCRKFSKIYSWFSTRSTISIFFACQNSYRWKFSFFDRNTSKLRNSIEVSYRILWLFKFNRIKNTTIWFRHVHQIISWNTFEIICRQFIVRRSRNQKQLFIIVVCRQCRFHARKSRWISSHVLNFFYQKVQSIFDSFFQSIFWIDKNIRVSNRRRNFLFIINELRKSTTKQLYDQCHDEKFHSHCWKYQFCTNVWILTRSLKISLSQNFVRSRTIATSTTNWIELRTQRQHLRNCLFITK